MRTVTIDYTDLPETLPLLGYVGEHNATELEITPPSEMSNNTDITGYRVAFGVEGKIYRSQTLAVIPLTCLMWQDVTQGNVVTIQLEGYDNNGDLVVKSPMLYGKLLSSVDGVDEDADFTDPVLAEIAANTLARHTHSNKTTLDNFGEDNGAVTYNGDALATATDLAGKQDTLTAGANITITGTTISADIDNTREISAGGQYSTYTAAELNAFVTAGLILTYNKNTVLNCSFSGNVFAFSVIEMGYNSGTLSPMIKRYNVSSSKVITPDTSRPQIYIPFSVNGKSFANIENITLAAGDIQAAAGWTPSNNTDLATKKYVDDNAGGAGAFIITITDNGGTPVADKTEAEIWDAWTNGAAVFVQSGDYRVPMILGSYEDNEYTFYFVAADLDTTVITYYALYDTSNGWELDMSGYVPPVTDVQVSGTSVLDGNGVANLAAVATSGAYSDLSGQPTIPTAGTITSGSTGYAVGGDVYTALQNVSVTPYVAQATAPVDTSVLWIDTDDNTVEGLSDADNSEY